MASREPPRQRGDANTRIERVTALVGHELRVPIAVALMHLGLARRQVDADRTDAASSALTTVQRELHRMDRLLSRLIELEERGRAVINPRLVDLGAVVNATVADTLAAEPGARPHVVLDMGPRIVGSWDAAAVEEIVRNLLSNAIRFGRRRPIRVSVKSSRKDARIVVEDHGRGIVAADHARIFARGTHAPRQQGGGLGLGLWLVKQLVRGHGGRVTVKSRPGEGATFTVNLPQRRARAAPTPEQATRDDGDYLRRPEFSSSRLLAFARHLMRAASIGAILAAAREEVKAVAGYQHVWFLVADREDLGQLRLLEYAGTRSENVWDTAPLLNVKGDKFLEELVASDGPVVIEDARTDPRTDKRLVEQLQNRTLISIPLRLLDRPLGVFGIGTFGDEGCRAPSPRELDHFVAIAGQVAVALTRCRPAEG
jgi:anti-sigma regulatory factor (Ser/Thr protein kinase)